MKRIINFVFALVLVVPGVLVAQSFGISQDQVQVDVRPAVIQPNFPVTFDVVSYSTDINRAYVAYYVDGVLVQDGIGLKNFSVDAPAVGQNMNVEIRVRTTGQGTVTKTYNIRPAQVDLLYEATNSYAPAMYQGKKLPAHQGGVRMVAIPYFIDSEGRRLSSDSLIYNWSIDGNPQVDSSGFGRDILEFEGPEYYRDRRVSVEVTNVDGNLVAEREIALPTYEPVIRFYRENPLWGTEFSAAITADSPLRLSAAETTIRSVPFFVSDASLYDVVDYQWTMNGAPTQVYGNRNLFNLRVPTSGSGTAQIELEIDHQQKLLQIAHSVFTVVFGTETDTGTTINTSGSNFFGSSN